MLELASKFVKYVYSMYYNAKSAKNTNVSWAIEHNTIRLKV